MEHSKEGYTCIIPVRFNSSRFPGKPLALINGKTMLEHVVCNAQQAQMVSNVVVAANGEEMVNFCIEKNIDHVAVDTACQNGSEAVSDVVKKVQTSDYVFELQGDQPLVTADVIDEFLHQAQNEIRSNSAIDIIQPYARASIEMIDNKDVVKVVVSNSGRFLTFTRLPIQSGYRTLGLYLWNKETLSRFSSMKVSELETAETCHLVRFVMNDLFVQGVQIDDTNWIEVDRPEHVSEVENIMKHPNKNIQN